MKPNEFAQWVEDRINDLQHNNHKYDVLDLIEKLKSPHYRPTKIRYNEHYDVGAIRYGNFCITWDYYERTVTIFNTKTERYGTAKCMYGDTMDLKTGIAIAWAHYNEMPIPSVDHTIQRYELVNGDKFISSQNTNNILTFVGWLPDVREGAIGKWAAVLDSNKRILKTQIAKEVVKVK